MVCAGPERRKVRFDGPVYSMNSEGKSHAAHFNTICFCLENIVSL